MKIKYLCYSLVVSGVVTSSNSLSNDSVRWEKLQTAVESRSIRSAFKLFRSNGVEPILIKGWAAGRFYRAGHFRPTSDVDLTVGCSDFEIASRLCRSTKPEGFAIDLHRELRHLDTCSWQDLFANSQIVDLDGEQIRVLRPEDHLRVIAVHWLTDGGWFRDRLWDIYYAIENRPVDFDWDRCLNSVSLIRRRWIVCVIGLTHRVFDLRIDDLPIGDEVHDLPPWFVRAVEREWTSSVRLLPLYRYTRDPRGFLVQVKKRLPPNPIYATVDMEGSFDASTRIHYQIGTIAKRIVPSIKRLFLSARTELSSDG